MRLALLKFKFNTTNIMSNKIFTSIDSLKPVEALVADASKALSTPYRTIKDSPLRETLAGVLGAGAGGGIGLAALYYGGAVFGLSAAGISSGLAAAGALVGGGMAAGIAVLASPAVILGGTAIYVTKSYREKKLKQEKERLYKEALKKHAAIINELNNKAKLSKERADYLEALNIMLKDAINKLRNDMEDGR